MRTSTKIVAALGVVSGMGASLLPCGTIVADTSKEIDLTATVKVSNSISLSSYEESLTVTPGASDPATTSVTANAKSNDTRGYKITLAATDGDPTTHAGWLEDGGGHITSNANLGPGDDDAYVSGWAVKTPDGGASTWQVVPGGDGATALVGATHANSASAADGDNHAFTFGVAVGSSFLAGEYTGTVTFTIISNV